MAKPDMIGLCGIAAAAAIILLALILGYTLTRGIAAMISVS